MQRTAPSPFDADAGFHNDTVQFPPPASSIGSSVTLAHPVKRITFFKSGDTQFKGVKMAIHKRSFKCFDALLDDLSQKVPLPFGVRTITTPKGTHNIKNLEQFEDGGCYLCSDHRSVKPINLEAAGKRSMVWHSQSHPNNTRRKPSRPDEPPSGHPHHHRQPKRIILVKNSDPSVRRSIVLSRRTARSLRVFIEEISELMQCHVKKLYTLEGHKIDSIQGLVQCPSVLVCVGREPFRPVLMENLRKLSDERLPGMSARSHSSIFSEGHESRKNVNFGLETKKSIIHPRSDSSNRSTRFSLSSDKSYQNGFCMTPRQSGCVSTCPYVKEIVVNDDIEKRVLVNKDGSLSVEMKVRFRLFNDETLQWSTEIKKSSSKENESTTVKDVEYLQAKAEHSDPDSICASDGDDAFAPKLHQKHNDETLCQNCCNHIQEYDIWKNPMHKNKGSCKSPSSTESSQKVVHKKSSMDSTRTISCSSGEYMEQVVEKASCFQQTMEEGDTRVEYCEVSRCCSRSEVSSAGNMSKNKKSSEDHCGSQVKNKCPHTDIIEPEISPMSQCDLIRVKEERPISAVSNSSKVLESLKEDQDDDYDDLPPSVSRASDWSQSDHVASEELQKCVNCCDLRNSAQSYLSPRPPSKKSTSPHSLKHKRYRRNVASPADPDGLSSASHVSKGSSRISSCHCGEMRTSSVTSNQNKFKGANSRTSSRHSRASSLKSRVRTNTPGSKSSDASRKSAKSGLCSCCAQGLSKVVGSEKAESVMSNKSSNSCEYGPPFIKASEGEAPQERCASATSKISRASLSVKSNCSAHKSSPAKSLRSEHDEVENVEDRIKSAMSAVSDCNISEREATPALVLTDTDNAEEKANERAVSAISACSHFSSASRTSHKSRASHSGKAQMPRSSTPNDSEEVPSASKCSQDSKIPQDARPGSAISNKTNLSSEYPTRGSKSSVNSCELQDKTIPKSNSPNIMLDPEMVITVEENQCRPLSNCSKTSLKSNTSSKSQAPQPNLVDKTQNALTVTSPLPRKKRSPSPINSQIKKTESPTQSDISAHSNLSSQSKRSRKCNCINLSNDHLRETPKENGKDDTDERSSVKSQLSSKLLINNQSDESRSGTAASVSLGLEEEQKCDDFEEQSTCCVKDGGDKLDTEERPKTNASMNSAVSGKSNKSHNSTSKTHVSTESGMSAELKKSKSGSQLNENNIRVPSALSLSSSHCKSPSRVSQRNTKHTAKKEGDCEAGNNNNPPEITVGSSNHQRASGKTTPASDRPESSKVSEQAATSKDGQSTKESDNRSKCSSKCLEINDGIQEIPNKIKSSAKGLDSSNESVLSRALSAADLLREIVSSDRPASRGSRSVSSSKNVDKVENKSQKSSKSKLSKSSECNRELIPSCLPNASPTEVVNDWLKNIPTDGYVYEIDAELNQDLTKIQGGEDSVFGDKGEVPESIIEVMEPHDTADNCDATHVWNERARLETSDSKALSNQDSLKNQCHSSVQVMKVLLGPKLDRSSSLPEVSHVYGRKLSQSAQGLLDCLANLRLIDSDPKDEKHQKYNEIMTILQSLWLQNPTDDDTKDNQGEDESNLRSSGVDETCVSNCCVKDTTNGDEQIVDNTQDTKTPSPEQDDEVNDGGNCTECLDAPRVLSKSVTPDIAQRVHESPEHEEQSEDQENDVVHEDVSSSENKNESDQTPQTTSYKSSGNESYTMKSPEDTSSGTPPSVQRAPLTKRVSQDPNPVWVLSLLKKLEKQFMLHYTDAMAEFKVKWDLDDNEMLNTMISELKEEVHKRIQSSINRELQKIQSRAGRGPRPPINALSRESTAQTEQRRKRLRVMRNKSILTRSDEDYTASGTENSDQRSEDEYCPCDACVKKKMASRAAQRAQALSTAPVMMEFDLRKILQMKKDPVKSPEPISEEPDLSCPVEKCENNLEVVHEEVDEVTEDTRGGTAEQEESGDAVNTNDEGDTKENEEEIEEEPTAEEDGEDKDSPGNDAANTQNGEMSAEIEAEETDAKEAQNETEYDNAEDGSESKSSKDDAHEKTEEKKADRIPNEKLTSANQDGSEDGSSEKGNDEDQPQETCKSPDMVVRENSVGGHDETVENTIAKQATRTSVESQPGSEENNEIQTPQAKLKDLQSFMESVESQADSMVVITKQPPYKDPHEPGKQNGLIEWQVSPKIAIRGNKHNIQKSEQ